MKTNEFTLDLATVHGFRRLTTLEPTQFVTRHAGLGVRARVPLRRRGSAQDQIGSALSMLLLSVWIPQSEGCISVGTFFSPELDQHRAKYHISGRRPGFEYPYWKLPEKLPEEAEEEAVMLVGGIICPDGDCNLEYVREEENGTSRHEHSFEYYDRTVKFYTQYGFCRFTKSKRKQLDLPALPAMPDAVTGVGAVAMPDGRVLICGGIVVEVMKGGVLGAHNNTMCYYWVAKSREIKPLEYFSKLPFNWLGPFTPKLMQMARFRNTVAKDGNETKQSTEKPDPHLSRQEKALEYEKRMADYRVIIIPWPPYTSADAETDNLLLKGSHGGDLIEGQLKVREYGPRMYWKRHKLGGMPLGYGGCYALEELPSGHLRVHTFGGRELYVDRLLKDHGWTQNPNHLVRYARYFDIGITRREDVRFCDDDPSPSCPANHTYLDFDMKHRSVVRSHCSAENDAWLPRNIELNEKFSVLSEDRVFHTCHLLPSERFNPNGTWTWVWNDVILLGGGSAAIGGRSRISAALRSGPAYRSVARYKLHPTEAEMKDCQWPELEGGGRGRWIQHDKNFGFGLNVARTRHASEIIKTSDPLNKDTSYRVVVFGGYSKELKKALDTVESFELGIAGKTHDNLGNFVLHDADATSEDPSSFAHRLPWPLMDMTSVKIPVEWLPPECYAQYKKSRRRHRIRRTMTKKPDQASAAETVTRRDLER